MRLARQAGIYVLLLAGSVVVGTAWHELVGHGLTGVLCGGRITYVEVTGVQLWPELSWLGYQGRYGFCDVTGIPTATGTHLARLAGSLSTWCVAVVATILLWWRPWRGWRRPALIVLSVWWVDLLLYTLPSWGIRRSILWGTLCSEPYAAAVGLGIPGPLLQAFAVGTSVALAAALAIRLFRHSPTEVS